ncbi:MAG TPA: hypothetical protein VMF56_13910 [Acidobacteriaceae bacterium]|nr:hypothetical protein [Acidobacteriaceae bacterium]
MAVNTYLKDEIKVADELFLIVALLHREHPDKSAFSLKEIMARAEQENMTGKIRPGVKQHAYEHAVANIKPGSGKYKMLYRTTEGKLRLLHAGDDVHPGRTGKIWPNPEEVPEQYRPLITWAQKRYAQQKPQGARWLDGIFQMRGLGRKLWAGQDADEYVSQLRKDWQ